MHDETTQTLNGRSTRQSFRLAQDVNVRLKEATPMTGGLVFDMCAPDGGLGAAAAPLRRARPAAPASSANPKSGKDRSGRKRGRR
jgi:ribonuclease R